MTTPKPFVLLLSLVVIWTGCATSGPMHLYVAGQGAEPVEDRALESGPNDQLAGFLEPGDVVVGLGYEFNTDYIWLRLAPGNRLITIKRGFRELWYDYDLPAEFMLSEGQMGDLAVRSFNRLVYVALAEPGRIGRVERYGKVRESFQPGGVARPIGGLAWDQRQDQLVVLYADAGGEVVFFENESAPMRRVTFDTPLQPTTLAYDSNRERFYIPLSGGSALGEFDREGKLLNRLPWTQPRAAIDAGQRSAVRMF
ncbi:MAG: hypothetical protein SynsKO_19310 [Synoicihabitans sp.]